MEFEGVGTWPAKAAQDAVSIARKAEIFSRLSVG
jgi:hypothetical protein